MAFSLFSLVPESRIADILGNLHDFTGLSIQLIDGEGTSISTYGEMAHYCSLFTKNALDHHQCMGLHQKAGRRAQTLGESYIYTCHANLNHIAFPLSNHGDLLGTIVIGPFLMDTPDSTLVSDLADRYALSTSLSLELYEALNDILIYSPQRVGQLKKLVDQLLSPLLPSERALLLQTQQKMNQQSQINETIQNYKEQKSAQSLAVFYQKEKELLSKVRFGTIREVNRLLNELIGYVLFCQGSNLESIRIRAIELTSMLSRIAIESGVNPDPVQQLNEHFLSQLYREPDFDSLCLLMQNVLENFMNVMFSELDKGNPYIRKALHYMAENFKDHLELSQVAEYVQLSPSYFSSLFHEIVGVSFREQLCKIRVEESKRLLLTKEYSLADIALAVGFPDQSYYCKVFKRIVGITPGKYRA